MRVVSWQWLGFGLIWLAFALAWAPLGFRPVIPPRPEMAPAGREPRAILPPDDGTGWQGPAPHDDLARWAGEVPWAERMNSWLEQWRDENRRDVLETDLALLRREAEWLVFRSGGRHGAEDQGDLLVRHPVGHA